MVEKNLTLLYRNSFLEKGKEKNRGRLIWKILQKSGGELGRSLFGGKEKKKKRAKLTPKQRLYIWEHPKIYGRTCSICHQRITKLSDLELDHTKSFSKGGKKLALAHRDCNRMKASGSLRKIQKRLGLKVTKRKKTTKKRKKRERPRGIYWVNPLTGKKEPLGL